LYKDKKYLRKENKMSTIVAISTAPGNGGIGIVRMSGEDSFEILKKVFKPAQKMDKIKGYTIKYGNIVDEKENIIDEVLVSFFVEPKSYTAENMCEINSHGNNIILKKILELCIKNGAILAEPGEFTKRAFLNGRIDLLQAEAVIDIINSKSEKERISAINQLEGELSKKIIEIKNEILEILTNLEVSIDYPEYDIEEKTSQEINTSILRIKEKLKKLEDSFERGKLLRDGIKVAIVGRPNAGKSSLLNRILKEDRAIVTDIEGTTRDTIEEFVTIKGVLFKIIDTAGIRKSDNEIEMIGIDKSKKALNEADLVIALFDKTKILSKEDFEILNIVKNKNSIILLNKKDLEKTETTEEDLKKYSKDILEVSIKDDDGIEELYNRMLNLFTNKEIKAENAEIITNIRHKDAISDALKSIISAENTINDGMTIDITAIYFKEAIENLNKITGEDVTDDIINDIFSKFCLGK
jgi:tRNA modification GTPase